MFVLPTHHPRIHVKPFPWTGVSAPLWSYWYYFQNLFMVLPRPPHITNCPLLSFTPTAGQSTFVQKNLQPNGLFRTVWGKRCWSKHVRVFMSHTLWWYLHGKNKCHNNNICFYHKVAFYRDSDLGCAPPHQTNSPTAEQLHLPHFIQHYNTTDNINMNSSLHGNYWNHSHVYSK